MHAYAILSRLGVRMFPSQSMPRADVAPTAFDDDEEASSQAPRRSVSKRARRPRPEYRPLPVVPHTDGASPLAKLHLWQGYTGLGSKVKMHAGNTFGKARGLVLFAKTSLQVPIHKLHAWPGEEQVEQQPILWTQLH